MKNDDVMLYAHEAAKQVALEAVRAVRETPTYEFADVATHRIAVYREVYEVIFGIVYQKLSSGERGTKEA